MTEFSDNNESQMDHRELVIFLSTWLKIYSLKEESPWMYYLTDSME